MGINVTDPQLGHGCVDMSLKAIKEKKKDIIDPMKINTIPQETLSNFRDCLKMGENIYNTH